MVAGECRGKYIVDAHKRRQAVGEGGYCETVGGIEIENLGEVEQCKGAVAGGCYGTEFVLRELRARRCQVEFGQPALFHQNPGAVEFPGAYIASFAGNGAQFGGVECLQVGAQHIQGYIVLGGFGLLEHGGEIGFGVA